MLLQSFVAVVAFLSIVAVALVVVLPYVNESFHDSETYLAKAKNVCATATLVWLFVAVYSPGVGGTRFFIVAAAVASYGLTLYFIQKAEDLLK
jgi:hypothetical protein